MIMSQTSPFGRSLHYEAPCFEFPGDEAVEQDAYARCMDNWYATVLPELEIAAATHGLDLSDEALERGRRMLSGQYWLDDLIDRRTGDSSAYEPLLRSLPAGSDPAPFPDSAKPELISAVTLLRNSMQTLPADAQHRIVEGGLEIRDLTDQQVAATSIGAYIKARRIEGEVTGRLIAVSLGTATETVPADYEYWLKKVVAGLALGDHASDLRDDHENGLTQVTPTRLHQLRLMSAAVSSLSMTLTTGNGRKVFYQGVAHASSAFRNRRQIAAQGAPVSAA
jgi:hypothetical protein